MEQPETILKGFIERYVPALAPSLDATFLGNTFLAWLLSALLFALVSIALWIVLQAILVQLRAMTGRTKMRWDDALVDVAGSVSHATYVAVSLFVAVQHLNLPRLVDIAVKGFFLLMLVVEGVKIIERIAISALSARFGRSADADERRLSAAMVLILRVVLWSVGLMLVLSNLGVNITSLIAGLGIGGIAISLALQNVLGDIFSSFAIIIDKPFEEGDFIVSGNHKGTVKHIGLKTTRLQALQGEEIVISNAELTGTRIQNFKKMQKRRVEFTFGVTYDTPPEKLEKIPAIVKATVESKQQTEFDRAHFKSFGDSSLDFEVVYFMTTSDYNVYMDTQQAINLTILEVFAKEGIEMAFPTRTVHLLQS